MKTPIAILLLCISVSAQHGSLTLGAGGATQGLGYHAGSTINADADLSHGRLELLDRLTVDLAHKIGSDSGSTLTNRFIARYGSRWRFGGGLSISRVTASFGARTGVSPLVHVAYSYDTERWRAVPYATVRLWEFGTNYTKEHQTRGGEAGLELYQRWGRIITKQAAGVEVLWYHNLADPQQRSGAYGFVRAGIGVVF